MLSNKYTAEFLGTFWLVFGGCGSAIIAAAYPGLGIGFLGVALAFGLTVLTMAYAFGGVSGAHFNPAVSIGLTVAGRFPRRDLTGYIISQLAGALVASMILYWIARGNPTFSTADGFASNGYGLRSPGGYSLFSCLLAEFVLTFGFLMVILGVTDKRNATAHAPLAIGLALTLIHLVSIPITNTSVNPARSTGPALFAGREAIMQLWLFWLAPILGAISAGVTYAMVFEKPMVKPRGISEVERVA